MGRWVNFIYGGLMIFVALEAMIPFIQIFPGYYIQFVVLALGVLVFLTPMNTIRRVFTKILGLYIIISSLMFIFTIQLHSIGIFLDASFLSNTFMNSFSGQLILLLIGVIYLLGGFARTRNIQICGM